MSQKFSVFALVETNFIRRHGTGKKHPVFFSICPEYAEDSLIADRFSEAKIARLRGRIFAFREQTEREGILVGFLNLTGQNDLEIKGGVQPVEVHGQRIQVGSGS